MKPNSPAQMTDADLLKSEKTTKTVLSMFIGALIVLVFANIFLLFAKGFSALNVIPIALIPILILNFNSLKQIRAEIKRRNLKS